MSKLLSVLVAGLFAGGAIAQTTTTTTPAGPGNSGAKDTPSGQYGVNTCPPGLVKKDNGCLPPGQVGKQDSTTTLGNTGGTTGGSTTGTTGGTSGGTMGGTTGGTAGSGSGGAAGGGAGGAGAGGGAK